jgi:4-hydroxybenzoate polyprenyltransferase
VRLVHPAPTAAVTALSAALATILAAEGGGRVEAATIALITASVAGSQIFTGATNDLTDQSRDAILRPEKPLPAGDLSASAALWIAAGGLALQIGTAARLGALPLVLGVLGLLAIVRGTRDARRLWQGILAAAILWTIAWALASGPAG